MNAFLAISLPFSGGAVERLGWTLVHSLWQLALVAFLALVTVRAMRRSSAMLRYGVLVAAVVLSVALPAATWVLLPALASDLSPRGATSDPRNFNPEANTPIDPTARVDRTPVPGDSSFAQLPPNVSMPNPAALLPSDSIVRDARDTRRAVPSLWSRTRSALRPWFAWIVAGWSIGVVVCSLRPLMGWHTLRRLRRAGVLPAPDEVLAAARRVSQRLAMRRAVHVLQSTLAQVPVVIGYLRPVVLLPVSLVTSIPTRQLEAILAHELAHVLRHDFLVNLLQTLVETLLFYHPATWWLSHQIRVEREHCCDDLAMSFLGSRVEYGRALLAIEELRGQSTVLALGAAGGSLVSRIRRIAGVGPDGNAASLVDRWPAVLVGLGLIGATWAVTLDRTLAAEDRAAHGVHARKLPGSPGGTPDEAKGEPARLRIRNPDGSAAQFDDVVEARIGFPESSPDGWEQAPTRDGTVSLENLPAGTHWLVAGGSLALEVKIPADRPIIERRPHGNRDWLRNDIETRTAVKSDGKDGDTIVIGVLNTTRHALAVSEQDVQIMAEINDEPIRGLSPQWQKADFRPIKIDPGNTGELRLNWRAWAREGVWSTRIHEVMAEPKLPAPDHGRIWVRVCIDNRGPDVLNDPVPEAEVGSDLIAVADPKAIAPANARDQGAAAPPNEVNANGEIVGQLTDATTGKPVEGATIACGALINDSGKGGGADAVTDAQGRYRLAVPSPGIYNVWLKRFDQDRSKTAAADDGIRVEAGKIATSQLQLVVGRKVSGKVTDSAGKLYAKMEVYCYSGAQPESGGPQSATTGADGGFEFALPPGRAHLYVIEPDRKHPEVPFAVSRSADAIVQVPAAGAVPAVTLTLEASQPKFGDPKWIERSTAGTQIVRREGNKDVTGTVVGEDGKPIAGARVFPEDGTPVLTNEKGEFRVETMKGTQFIMHAVAPGYHAWFGTPTSGDVLKIVLERKPPARPEQGALPPAQNFASRTFELRFKLASDSAQDLRQILLGRPGYEAKPSANNQAIAVTAPPEVLNRVQTFLAVTDWPDNLARGGNFEYPRDTVTRAARSFFHACAIEDTDEVFSKILSLAVLAELKGDTKSEKYENYITGGVPDPEWETRLRGDWPGKKAAIRRLVREWNRYPLKRITERDGVAIGFGVKNFCSVSFDGAPKDFYDVTIEPDRNAHGAANGSFLFSTLPPWPDADPKAAAADEKSFQASAKIDADRHGIEFFLPPTVGALRQLERLEGDWTVTVRWPGPMDKSAAAAFEGIHVKEVRGVELAEPGNIDAWLKELTRSDTGLKDLTTLDLYQTQVTDAGLKELARSDSGLKSLTSLDLRGTQVTDVGLKDLTRPDNGLKSLASLSLRGTQITSAGLRELARQDTGLKALTSLDLGETKVTDADLKELYLQHTKVTEGSVKTLQQARPGLRIEH